MNDAEKVLHDFKQSLAQVVFYHLDQVKAVFKEDDAVSVIGEELEKMGTMFGTSSSSLFSSLSLIETEWKEKHKAAVNQNKYQDAMYAEEVLNALRIVKGVAEGSSE